MNREWRMEPDGPAIREEWQSQLRSEWIEYGRPVASVSWLGGWNPNDCEESDVDI